MIEDGKLTNEELEKFRLNFSSCKNRDVAPSRTKPVHLTYNSLTYHTLKKRAEDPRLFDKTELTAPC